MLVPIALILVQNAIAQNLIKNGGFEDNVELRPECYKVNCESNNMKLIEPFSHVR